MAVDALNSSHPISTPVEDPAQILEMFDDVSYEKVKYITAVDFSCTACTTQLYFVDFTPTCKTSLTHGVSGFMT